MINDSEHDLNVLVPKLYSQKDRKRRFKSFFYKSMDKAIILKICE